METGRVLPGTKSEVNTCYIWDQPGWQEDRARQIRDEIRARGHPFDTRVPSGGGGRRTTGRKQLSTSVTGRAKWRGEERGAMSALQEQRRA
jgi:hypothetical protein